MDQSELDPARRTRCEIYTRVMGYHRPISQFNIGKQGEVEERLLMKEDAPKTVQALSYLDVPDRVAQR